MVFQTVLVVILPLGLSGRVEEKPGLKSCSTSIKQSLILDILSIKVHFTSLQIGFVKGQWMVCNSSLCFSQMIQNSLLFHPSGSYIFENLIFQCENNWTIIKPFLNHDVIFQSQHAKFLYSARIHITLTQPSDWRYGLQSGFLRKSLWWRSLRLLQRGRRRFARFACI